LLKREKKRSKKEPSSPAIKFLKTKRSKETPKKRTLRRGKNEGGSPSEKNSPKENKPPSVFTEQKNNSGKRAQLIKKIPVKGKGQTY